MCCQLVMMSDRSKIDRQPGLEVLCEASLRLNSSLALPDVLNSLVHVVRDVIADLISLRVFLQVEGRLTIGTAWWPGSTPGMIEPQSPPDELVYRAANAAQLISAVSRKSGKGGVFISTAVPLINASRLVGVFVFNRPGEVQLSEELLEVLSRLADQAALAISNAQLFEHMSKQAYTDSLTGLPNRRAFDLRLEEETLRSSRYNHTFSLLMLDVNDFKEINDTYGHPVGDRILQHVTGCLRMHLRDTDFFARFGGDEFAIILPETEFSIAHHLVRRLKSVVEGCDIDLFDGALHNITISVGLASYPQHAISASALMIAADQALYRSKRYEDVYLDNS